MMDEYAKREQEKTAWLANLKPGDEAFVPARWGVGSIRRVERLTATQIVLVGGEKFRRDSGRSIGRNDAFGAAWIQPVAQDVRDAIEKHRLCDWLDNVNRNRKFLTAEALRAMKAAHDANKPEETQ